MATATAKITYEEKDAWDAEDYIPKPVLGTGPLSLELPESAEPAPAQKPTPTSETETDPNKITVYLPTTVSGGQKQLYKNTIRNAMTNEEFHSGSKDCGKPLKSQEAISYTSQLPLLLPKKQLSEEVAIIIQILNDNRDYRIWMQGFHGPTLERIIKKMLTTKTVDNMILSTKIMQPIVKYESWSKTRKINEHMVKVYNAIVYKLDKHDFINNDVFKMLTYLGMLMLGVDMSL